MSKRHRHLNRGSPVDCPPDVEECIMCSHGHFCAVLLPVHGVHVPLSSRKFAALPVLFNSPTPSSFLEIPTNLWFILD
ncbi:hypothetical protein TSUD_10720 [Trifolium subterraneum]|nr:hypothetical protein TSUD_10720 [Trifolium subterraneum]